MRLARRLLSASGVTIIEITVMLAASIALAGALAPTVSAFLRDARITTATTYVNQLVSALQTAQADIGFAEFKVDGDGKSSQCDDCVVMLVSDGDIPNQCTVSTTDGCGTPTPPGILPANSWLRPVQPDSVPPAFTFIDFFDRHLVLDLPGNNAANTYVTAWRGAYINTPISSDPWGNRYMFSAENMNQFPDSANVLSAGPDEAIDTLWISGATTAGKDDISVAAFP